MTDLLKENLKLSLENLSFSNKVNYYYKENYRLISELSLSNSELKILSSRIDLCIKALEKNITKEDIKKILKGELKEIPEDIEVLE